MLSLLVIPGAFSRSIGAVGKSMWAVLFIIESTPLGDLIESESKRQESCYESCLFTLSYFLGCSGSISSYTVAFIVLTSTSFLSPFTYSYKSLLPASSWFINPYKIFLSIFETFYSSITFLRPRDMTFCSKVFAFFSNISYNLYFMFFENSVYISLSYDFFSVKWTKFSVR
jgi:hypothetical protein